MPTTKPLTKQMARSLHSFYRRLPLDMVEDAIDAGRNVELVESTFSDPSDYVEIHIDGTKAFRESGY